MKQIFLLLISSIGILISCVSHSTKHSIVNNNTDSLVNAQKQKKTGYNNKIDDTNENDCIRGQAAPTIKKSVFPKTSFMLQKDSITGIETVELDSGDTLIIKNWGCEYYCLTFRFETTRFQNDTTNLKYWF